MITGGAGGIGVEVAHRLYAKGANVVLTDLDEAKLAAIADEAGAVIVYWWRSPMCAT